MPDSSRKVYRVAELTRLVRLTLERQIGHVWVEGELSNVRRPASGHYYLTIKDATSQLSGVLFRGDQRTLTFRPVDGMQVRVFGGISVYERSGNYQIIIRQIEDAGKGSLQERFEKLKEALNKEGLFAPERKVPLPVLPQHVGVITSGTGAAIRDILNVISRRFPNLHVVLWPVRVQGEGAAREIAEAVRGFDRRGGIDVVIVGRGGGSLEDLWCFNEEIVARAIAECSIPVISAVGHEIDFTISDFVADMRAPTPSAAAELVVGSKDAFEERLAALSRRLADALRQCVALARGRYERAASHYVFREPANVVSRYRQTVEGCNVRMAHELQRRVRDLGQRVDDAGLRLVHTASMRHQALSRRFEVAQSQLKSLNPRGVLQRGYSITRRSDGRVVRSPDDVATGERLLTSVAGGEIESDVTARHKTGDGE